MALRVVVGVVLAGLAVNLPASFVDPDESADLLADDECVDGVCALNELQLRASASKAEEEDEVAASYSRRRGHEQIHWASMEFGRPAEAAEPPGHGRRRRLVLWKATPIVDGDQQPETCGNTTLKKGYEGCCAGQLYEFANMGCCGSLLYRTDELACCRHRNATATIYNSLTSNCCDDPLKKNKESGVICHLEGSQSSCCHIETTGGRRHHHHHR
mmetsp:Transcript_76900/g.213041  ORF Transcript_76900/g.213041 Transcript_76900/m.213041 type:complete len:215 (+) Transcript_76900:116-760(+)